jgi:nitroimidazol reductase NimA-like FMN-containing flavoprotein (pyridoxamine 5'-phosphate oxidase superfamily)
MSEFPQTPRNRVRRLPERGSYAAESIYAVIDAALICHVALIEDGLPVSIPTLHARSGERIYLHGSPGSRLVRHLRNGGQVSLSFALVDGLVAAKSVFHHSLNYRSAVVFGRGSIVEGREALLEGLRAFTEKILPGRWDEARRPSEEELRVTALAQVSIESASAKQRSGGPKDDEADLALPVWNGVIPLRAAAGLPQAESDLPLSPSIAALLRRYQGD